MRRWIPVIAVLIVVVFAVAMVIKAAHDSAVRARHQVCVETGSC